MVLKERVQLVQCHCRRPDINGRYAPLRVASIGGIDGGSYESLGFLDSTASLSRRNTGANHNDGSLDMTPRFVESRPGVCIVHPRRKHDDPTRALHKLVVLHL